MLPYCGRITWWHSSQLSLKMLKQKLHLEDPRVLLVEVSLGQCLWAKRKPHRNHFFIYLSLFSYLKKNTYNNLSKNKSNCKKRPRLNIVNWGNWLGSPTNIKVTNKDFKVYVGRSTTLHNLLFSPHTLCMSYVTNTFLLVSSSVGSKQLLCFVQGQG